MGKWKSNLRICNGGEIEDNQAIENKKTAVRCLKRQQFLFADNLLLVIVIYARLEHTFVNAANRAYPAIGNIFKSGTGCNAMFGIAFFRIICVATGITKIFFHFQVLLIKL
jgi:hypothetical protein